MGREQSNGRHRKQPDVLYNHAFERMEHKLKARLHLYDHEIYRFGNHVVKAQGDITLSVELGKKGKCTTNDINLLGID